MYLQQSCNGTARAQAVQGITRWGMRAENMKKQVEVICPACNHTIEASISLIACAVYACPDCNAWFTIEAREVGKRDGGDVFSAPECF